MAGRRENRKASRGHFLNRRKSTFRLNLRYPFSLLWKWGKAMAEHLALLQRTMVGWGKGAGYAAVESAIAEAVPVARSVKLFAAAFGDHGHGAARIAAVAGIHHSRHQAHRVEHVASPNGAIRPQPRDMRRRLRAGSCFVQQSLDVETFAMARFFSCISYLLVMAVGICAQTTGPARATVLRAERVLDVRQGTIERSPIIVIQAGGHRSRALA